MSHLLVWLARPVGSPLKPELLPHSPKLQMQRTCAEANELDPLGDHPSSALSFRLVVNLTTHLAVLEL